MISNEILVIHFVLSSERRAMSIDDGMGTRDK